MGSEETGGSSEREKSLKEGLFGGCWDTLRVLSMRPRGFWGVFSVVSLLLGGVIWLPCSARLADLVR